MMNNLKLFGVVVCIIMCTTQTFAQTATERTVGLTASLGQNNYNIMVPVWLGKKFTIAPVFGIKSTTSPTYTIGLVPRYYFKTEKLAPYLALNTGVTFTTFNGFYSSQSANVLLGEAFGGEYFFDAHFSVGVEAQLNLGWSFQKYGNNTYSATANLTTATVINASVYFGK